MAVKHLHKWSRADAVRRATRAWALRSEGHEWEDIARLVGYSSGSVACRSVRQWRESLPPIDVSRFRDEAIARCLWLIRQAALDVQEDRPGAVTSMVRAEARLSELVGLDAPREVTLRTPAAAELEAWVSRVAAATIVDVPEYDVIGMPLELGAAGEGPAEPVD